MSTNLHNQELSQNIVHIEYTDREDGYSDDLDNKIHLLKNVNVYADTQLMTVLRTEKKGSMIRFDREVIRGGKSLLRIVESNGSFAYIKKDPNATQICVQCMVKENRALDFVLISHEEFDHRYLPLPLESKVITDGHEHEFETNIRQEGDYSMFTVKDSFLDSNDNFISTLSFLTLKTESANFKIGRLEDFSKFYITSSLGRKKPKKILTAEGTEGIFFSPDNIYVTISTPLEKFINTLTTTLTILIILALIIFILAISGWIVFVGLIMVPVGLILSFLITAPLHFLIKYAYKFF